MRVFASTVLLVLLADATAAPHAAQNAGDDLPAMGSPVDSLITQRDEFQIGSMIVRGLRDQGKIVTDPEITEYVQEVGSRVAAHASEGGQHFTFFVVRDAGINAFALPGGFIGVNHGLILQTRDEAELAAVLAHEIAHVTQRHIARTIQAQGRQGLASAAAILAGILIGAVTGSPDAVQAGMVVAQGTAAQQQINFTRANEYEADRVGIGFLASAGYDPQAMPNFFEVLGRQSGLSETQVPEFFQTHPVSTNRIAESRARAAQYARPKSQQLLGYTLARERLRVIAAPPEADMRPYYERRRESGADGLAIRYGEALAMLAGNEPDRASAILQDLVAKNDGVIQLHAALGQAQMASGRTDEALATFKHAAGLFPRNVPLSVRYGEALIRAGRPKEAHDLLLDVFNVVAPTPEQIRLTALAASGAGDNGDAYYYMSEYHVSGGDLPLAMQNLEMALSVPNLTPVQRERFRARLQEIRGWLAEDRRNRRQQARNTDDGSRDGNGP